MHLQTLFVNWSNGTFIMTAIFGLVILGLIGSVIIFIYNSSKKERKKREEENDA